MTESFDKVAPKGWFMQRRSHRQISTRARQQRLADASITKSDDELIAEAVAKGRVTRTPTPMEADALKKS